MTSTRSAGCVPGLQQRKVFKIIVLGDSGVGKTCLTYRFCEGEFLSNAEATIGVDFRERTVKVFGEEVKLQLWDTAGQERFRKNLVKHYYRNAHAIIIVYDVNNPATFQSVRSWMEEVETHKLSGVPRALVGNKTDCVSRDPPVPTVLAQRLADHYSMPLFETSAKLDCKYSSIDGVMLTLAHKLYSQLPLRLASTQEENEDVVKLSKPGALVAAGRAPAVPPCCT